MSWFRRDLGKLALELATPRLVGHDGAFSLRDGERTFLGAFPCESSTELDPEPGLAAPLLASPLPRWLGLLPYDAFRAQERSERADVREPALLEHCLWHRYAAVAVHEAGQLRVEGEDSAVVERLASVLSQPARTVPGRVQLSWATPPEPGEAHAARVARALREIEAGRLYQVNLARRFCLAVQGHPLQLLGALGPLGQAPFSMAAAFGELGVVSGSPELFLDVSPTGQAETRPIKGTRPRGATPADDLVQRTELDASEKERAELTMVIDIERNDLGRIAEVGSVHVSRAPHVVTHPTVHHREAAVNAQIRSGIGRSELLRALMPSGSVTGAPKASAMQLISELEPARRGLYTGAIGTLGHDGHLRLSMAIRVLVVRGGVGHYFAGGGIVAESTPEQEVAETWWKTRLLSRLLTVEN